MPSTPDAVAKVHPASREMLPDDPMEITGFQAPGDPDLMLRMLVEEYARIGWGVDAVMRLALDSNYRAFHGLLRTLGEDGLRMRVSEIMSRCGVMRVKVEESEPVSDRLVQLELPRS